MKKIKLMTPLLCLIMALSLAGCGGGWTPAKVGGTVTGLTNGATLALSNAGLLMTVTANGSFSFNSQSSTAYNVFVGAQPVGEFCSVANGSGTVNSNGDSVNNIAVTCVQVVPVRGTISGLNSGTSVTLQDNAADSFILAADGLFVFPTAVATGTTFNVTVLTQPAGEICTVANGTGTADVNTPTNSSNVTVTCTTP